jgi:hypothetical protein
MKGITIMAPNTPKSNGPSWKLSFRKLTKQQARETLGMTRRQRALSEPVVSAYARTMDLGLWDANRPSQTPVAFDRDGYVINGQHRLNAFLRSKLDELTFPVITGCDPEDFFGFDQDVSLRTKNSAHPDRKNVARDQARVKWIEALVRADPFIRLTQPEFAHLADRTWRKQLSWADDAIKMARAQGRQAYVAAFMYAHRVDPVFADRIGRSWANGGEGLPATLLKFRDEALRDSGRRGTGAQVMNATFKLLNGLACMHRGESMPPRLQPTLSGLKYFSEKARDGAASRWSRAVFAEE